MISMCVKGFPDGSVVKNCLQTGDLGLIPGSGRFPGEGNGISLQHSCLGNHKDGGAWWSTVRCVSHFSCLQLFATLWTLPHQALLFMNYTLWGRKESGTT